MKNKNFIKTFENFKINEGAGEYRGYGSDFSGRLPSIEDIKDILKGLSTKKVLEWTPPKTITGEKRISLSKTEIDLKEKKEKLLKLYNCPESWIDKKLKLEKDNIVVNESSASKFNESDDVSKSHHRLNNLLEKYKKIKEELKSLNKEFDDIFKNKYEEYDEIEIINSNLEDVVSDLNNELLMFEDGIKSGELIDILDK